MLCWNNKCIIIIIVSLQLCKARTELESRITEHDHGVMEGFDKPEVTLQVRCTRDTCTARMIIVYIKSNKNLTKSSL